MKAKSLLFVVGVLLWQMASGLEMCKGPFKPPSIDDVTVDPVYGSGAGKVPIGARIVVKMTSSAPLTAQWKSRMGPPVEENPHFKSSMKADGDRYIFMAEDRLQGNRNNIAKLAKYTTLRVAANFTGCNTVRFIFDVSVLQEMAQQSRAIPTIDEMPFLRYKLDKGKSTNNMTTRLGLAGDDNGALNASLHCETLFIHYLGLYRNQDSLWPAYHLRKTFDVSHKTMKVTDGIAGGTCAVEKLGYYIKSETLGFQARVDVSPTARFWVFLSTEIRGPDIIRTAVSVETEPFGNSVWMGSPVAATIPATGQTTRFTCMTDAETVRNATVVQYLRPNKKKLLTLTDITTDELVPTIRYYIYDIESPPESWIRQQYECTVVDGDGRQNSVKFQVGATPIRVAAEPEKIHLSHLNDSTFNMLNIPVYAIGSPEVNLKIYAGIEPFKYLFDAKRFQQAFDGRRQITDSKDHRLFFQRRGAMLKGLLIVPDVRKLVPSGYWDNPDNKVYHVVCLAYREWEGKLLPLVNIYR